MAAILGCAAISSTGAIAAPPAAAPALPDEEALSLARAIIDRAYPAGKREPLFFAAMDQMVGQMAEATRQNLPDDPGLHRIIAEHRAEMLSRMRPILARHIPSLMDGWARAYAAIFTPEELQDILAFVSTPSGLRFFERSPAIIGQANFAAANQAYMDEIVALAPQEQAILAERIQRYLEAQNPPAPHS